MLLFLRYINPELHSRAKLINKVLCYPVILTEVQAFVHTSLKWLAKTNKLIILFPKWLTKGEEPSLDEMLKEKGFKAFLDNNGLGFDYAIFTNLNQIANNHKHRSFQIISFEDTYSIYTFLFNYSVNLYAFVKKIRPEETIVSEKKFLHFYNTLKNYSPYEYEKNMKEYKAQKAEIENLKKIIQEKDNQLSKDNDLVSIGVQTVLRTIKNSSISTNYFDKIKNKK